ncbi:hypothetical protein Leryth_009321 [Lithospermum erythrorhizon]|nr:hypothetical protein Leryth_009321 [Lithospermum erythrorhizon]
MGSCASVNKNKETLISSPTKKTLVHSPIKEKPLSNDEGLVESDVAFKADKISTPLRSKEEAFFDTQPWLESDGEDDFCSVNGGKFFPSSYIVDVHCCDCNGDFTPSLGNTPVHHNFSTGPKLKVTVPEDAPVVFPGSSPTKRLSELLDENLREHQDSECITGTSNVSGAKSVNSAEKIPNGRRSPDEKSVIRAKQCCLPRFRSNSSRRYSEEKKTLTRGNSTG